MTVKTEQKWLASMVIGSSIIALLALSIIVYCAIGSIKNGKWNEPVENNNTNVPALMLPITRALIRL